VDGVARVGHRLDDVEAVGHAGDLDVLVGQVPGVNVGPAHRDAVDHVGAVLVMLGRGQAAGGKWDLAEDHFQTALRQAEELPYEIEAAETRRFYAEMLVVRNAAGDRDRARSLVDEALVVYRRIGMPRHEELARRLVAT
jgi:hypothetical protein